MVSLEKTHWSCFPCLMSVQMLIRHITTHASLLLAEVLDADRIQTLWWGFWCQFPLVHFFSYSWSTSIMRYFVISGSLIPSFSTVNWQAYLSNKDRSPKISYSLLLKDKTVILFQLVSWLSWNMNSWVRFPCALVTAPFWQLLLMPRTRDSLRRGVRRVLLSHSEQVNQNERHFVCRSASACCVLPTALRIKPQLVV